MKKIRLILAFICACLLISGLTGCGFVVEEETIVITEIFYSEPDEEGTVTLTIVYEIDGREIRDTITSDWIETDADWS